MGSNPTLSSREIKMYTLEMKLTNGWGAYVKIYASNQTGKVQGTYSVRSMQNKSLPHELLEWIDALMMCPLPVTSPESDINMDGDEFEIVVSKNGKKYKYQWQPQIRADVNESEFIKRCKDMLYFLNNHYSKYTNV